MALSYKIWLSLYNLKYYTNLRTTNYIFIEMAIKNIILYGILSNHL